MSTSLLEPKVATNGAVVRRGREVRRHYLDQIQGEGSPQRFSLDQPRLVIGRAHEAEVPVASRRASRQHALLTRRATDYVLRDNESHNGVYLNGVRIYSATLREGDVIQIADCIFIYRKGW